MKRACMSVYGLWRYTYCDSLVFLLRKEAWFLENMIITANWVTTVYQTATGNKHFHGCKYGPSVKKALSHFKGSSYCLSPSRVGFHSQLERVQRGLVVCARTATFQSSSWHCVYELPRAICGRLGRALIWLGHTPRCCQQYLLHWECRCIPCQVGVGRV